MNTTARVKIWIAGICLAMLLPFFQLHLSAQTNSSDRVTKRLDRLKQELTLTDDQTTKVRDILTRAQAQAEKDREAHKGDRSAMMEAAKTRMQNTDKEITAVLTPDQVKKYDTLKDEMRENMKEHMHGRKQ